MKKTAPPPESPPTDAAGCDRFKAELVRLVAQFEKNFKLYQSPAYSEASVRLLTPARGHVIFEYIPTPVASAKGRRAGLHNPVLAFSTAHPGTFHTPPDLVSHMLQKAFSATDRAISARVYELYGLTPEEIALVEAPHS